MSATATATARKVDNEVSRGAPKEKKTTIRYPFWFGGSASCFAACVTHPLDLVKVRLQTQPKTGTRLNMAQMLLHITRTSGLPGLYSGLSASILRQMTYSTTRFGIYEELKRLSSPPPSPSTTSSSQHPPKPSFPLLILLSSTSGLLGGIAGNPADVLNVRMQNDASLPAPQRRNYPHALAGLVRITREEGLATLFRGVYPNSVRAALMTASQLASYDVFKSLLTSHFSLAEGLGLHFTASVLAGLVATTVCSPVDVIKTRVMSSAEKRGLGSVVGALYRAEGLGWMFRGWVPSFVRLGPHTIATFLFLEEHKKMWRRWQGADEGLEG